MKWRKVLAGAAVYGWAWYFYAPVCRRRIVHRRGRRVLRRNYVVDELRLHGGYLVIKKSIRARTVVATAGTLRIDGCVAVGQATFA